jgi:hypothetical protein
VAQSFYQGTAKEEGFISEQCQGLGPALLSGRVQSEQNASFRGHCKKLLFT